MKKQFFHIVAALALICGVFAFSGCTDFENDINEINDRLDKLETGSIASLEEQIATLTSSLDEAHNLLDLLQGNVEDLQAADEAMSQQIDALNGEIETVKGQISDLNGQISSLEEELNKKIDDAVAELKASDNAAAERISDLESDLEKAKEDLAKAIADGNANKEAIDELKQKVEDYYNELIDAIEKAETSHSEDIARLDGEISSLKEALAEQTQKLTDLIESVSELEKAVEYLEGLTANIPELENLVDSIQENYLSKEEAQNTFATLESVAALLEEIGGIEGRLDAIDSINVSVGERLQDLEDNYADLKDVIIPGLEADILAAQEAAAQAQESADAAMDFAKNVLGELETLRNALGIYAEAGALEAKMEALDAVDSTLKAKDEELAKLIDELDAAVAADIAGLEVSIKDLRDELIDLIDDIKADMVTKDGFDALFKQELNKALAEDGEITEAIAAAITEAREELQDNIDDANGRIDILDEALKDLSDDVAAVIEDLANRIQSLVFVPEYKDGMATNYYYTVGTYKVGDKEFKAPLYEDQKQRVIATFQVEPAELASTITEKNVILNVVPVKVRSAAAEAEPVSGDDLIITTKDNGRIEVDALVSAEYGENFAIALYVADEKTVSEDMNNFELIDAGNYVTSEYVQVKRNVAASDLSDNYVLYDFQNKKVFPADSAVEKPWTDAPAPVTFFEGYDLALNLGTADAPRYVTLADAEKELRLEEGSLTPNFDAISIAYPEIGNGITYVLDEEKGYGFTASMPSTKEEAVKHVGDELIQQNLFQKNGCNVIDVTTSYEITNKRYEITLKPKHLDWTYEFAKTYHVVYDMQEDPYEFREVGLAEASAALEEEDAYDNINEILSSPTNVLLEGTRTVEGGKTEVLTGLNASDVRGTGNLAIDALAFEEAQIATVNIDGYRFAKGKSVAYSFKKTYVNDNKHVEVVFNFDYTLGAMPEDMVIDLGAHDVNFVGASYIFTALNSNPIETAYNNGADYFKTLAAFEQSLYDETVSGVRNYTRQTWKTSVTPEIDLTDGGKTPYAGLWTFLGILHDANPNADADQPEYSYIRTSSSDVSKFGESFRFETIINTWYGVKYTFKATSTIGLPAFMLKYDEALAPNGTVQLNGSIDAATNKYDFPTVDFSNYVYIANPDQISKTSAGAYVKFEILDKVDTKNGILNIPTFTANSQSIYWAPTTAAGKIDVTELEWDGYTARELNVNAVLYLRTQQGTEIEVNRLPLTVITDDPITAFSTDALIISDRVSGEDYKINLWEQLVINGILDGDKNIAMYYGDKEPREYANLAGMVAAPSAATPRELYKYLLEGEANIQFAAQNEITYQVKDGAYTNAYVEYDPSTGEFTYGSENGALQNDLIITIPVKLHHKLDYNGVQAKTANLVITIQKQIDEIE